MHELASIKDLLITLSAGIGAIVAIVGINTWKRELSGKVEYNTARNLLKSTYELRDAISWVRNPFISAGEMVDKEKQNSEQPFEHKHQINTAYRNRWGKIIEANSEASANLLEAEVLWGQKICEEYNKLFQKVARLSSTIYLYFAHLDEPDAKLFNDDHEKILYSTGDDNDIFKKEIDSIIAEIEKILRPYLNRKKA